MSLFARRRDAPRAGAPPRDGGITAVAGLESQRDVAVPRGFDERPACVRERLAGMLLIAGEDDRDVQVAEDSGALQRFERVENDNVPALHIGAAHGYGCRIFTREAQTTRTWVYDGIEMADKQELHRPSLPAMLGDEVSRAADNIWYGCPARCEIERIERCAEHRSNLAHTVQIQSAAGNVDDAAQIGDLLFTPGFDLLADPALRPVERLRTESSSDQRDHRQDRGNTAGFHEMTATVQLSPYPGRGDGPRRRARTDGGRAARVRSA